MDIAIAMLNDYNTRANANDLATLLEDQLDLTRIFLRLTCEFEGFIVAISSTVSGSLWWCAIGIAHSLPILTSSDGATDEAREARLHVTADDVIILSCWPGSSGS